MTRRRPINDVVSPLLSIEQVQQMLEDTLGEIGAFGGGLGGRAGGGIAGEYGGASGGRAGGRFGARHFTRLDGERRVIDVSRTGLNLRTVRKDFFGGRAQEQLSTPPGAVHEAVMLIGIVGSGSMGMNPCVVQLVWFADQLHATAHAKEGLIKQRTCAKALQRLEDSLSPTR